jgi:polysaccharide biosynthesis/export protein
MNRIFAILLIITGLAFSCVSVKKLNYLQDEQAYRADYATDSVLASYRLQIRKYALKPEDIISLRIGSLTPREYDFVKQYEERLGEIRRLKQYSQGQQDQQGQMMRQGFGGFGGQGIEDAGLQAIALDRFNTGFILDRMGNLPLPNIGEVHLAGLTLAEAEVLIEKQLEGYFETPEVRIQLLSFQYTILGEVKQEGRYTTFKPESHIFDAITLAGNLTDFADRSRIKIVRQQGGIADVRYINLLKEDLLDNANYFLQPDDLIIVPALQARTWQRYVFPVSATTLSLVTAAVSLVLIFTTLN